VAASQWSRQLNTLWPLLIGNKSNGSKRQTRLIEGIVDISSLNLGPRAPGADGISVHCFRHHLIHLLHPFVA